MNEGRIPDRRRSSVCLCLAVKNHLPPLLFLLRSQCINPSSRFPSSLFTSPSPLFAFFVLSPEANISVETLSES